MKKIISSAICAVMIFMVTFSVYASDVDIDGFVSTSQMGSLMKDYDPDLAPVLLTTDGIQTTKNFDILVDMYVYENKCKDVDSVKKLIIKLSVFADDAEKNGVTVSDEELHNFILEQKENIQLLREEGDSSFDNFLEGMGMSETQYFNLFQNEYKNILLRAKYKNQMYREYIESMVSEKLRDDELVVSDTVFEELVTHEMSFSNETLSSEFKKFLSEYEEELLSEKVPGYKMEEAIR